MLPGTGYREYVWYGDSLPGPILYDDICARFWKVRATFDVESTDASAEVASASTSGETDTACTEVMSEPV